MAVAAHPRGDRCYLAAEKFPVSEYVDMETERHLRPPSKEAAADRAEAEAS
ncbi:MAG: hypothetical protein ACKVVT_07355 [Dehalococcoidia bacterium]